MAWTTEVKECCLTIVEQKKRIKESCVIFKRDVMIGRVGLVGLVRLNCFGIVH